MNKNLTEHVKSIEKDFDIKTESLAALISMKGYVGTREYIKSHLLLSQLKTIELLKEEIEKRRTRVNDTFSFGHDYAITEMVTLLDTIIQDIKEQIK